MERERSSFLSAFRGIKEVGETGRIKVAIIDCYIMSKSSTNINFYSLINFRSRTVRLGIETEVCKERLIN